MAGRCSIGMNLRCDLKTLTPRPGSSRPGCSVVRDVQLLEDGDAALVGVMVSVTVLSLGVLVGAFVVEVTVLVTVVVEGSAVTVAVSVCVTGGGAGAVVVTVCVTSDGVTGVEVELDELFVARTAMRMATIAAMTRAVAATVAAMSAAFEGDFEARRDTSSSSGDEPDDVGAFVLSFGDVGGVGTGVTLGSGSTTGARLGLGVEALFGFGGSAVNISNGMGPSSMGVCSFRF